MENFAVKETQAQKGLSRVMREHRPHHLEGADVRWLGARSPHRKCPRLTTEHVFVLPRVHHVSPRHVLHRALTSGTPTFFRIPTNI